MNSQPFAVDEIEIQRAQRKLAAMQEIALALVGQVDLDAVLECIVSKVSEIIDCDRATLFFIDHERQEIWSRLAEGLETDSSATKVIRLPLGKGIAGHVASSGDVVNVRDAYSDDRFDRSIDKRTGYRTSTLLAVPIPDKDGRVIGVLQALNKRDGGAFVDEDGGLLKAISNQISVSVSNALLFRELRENAEQLQVAKNELQQRVEELDALVEIERAMADTESLDELLAVVVKQTLRLLDAEAASIAMVDDKAGRLRFRAASGESAEKIISRTLPVSAGLIGASITKNEVILVEDATGDARHPGQFAKEMGFAPGPLMVVPVSAEKRVVGAIEVMRERSNRTFDDDDVRFLSLLAGHVAQASLKAQRREQSRRDAQLRTVGTMLSGIVHDFKTPMTVISGYVQLMASTDDEEEREGYADTVMRQTELMTSMTKELLAYARGDSEVLLRKVFLGRLIADVEHTTKSLLEGKKIQLNTEVGFERALRLDDTKVRRALMNLVTNAVEAMGDEGELTIRAYPLNDDVVVEVSDTGPGIPEAIEGTLFDGFSTYGKESGTGLGLAVVEKIMSEHSGRVNLVNTDAGATFELIFPANR